MAVNDMNLSSTLNNRLLRFSTREEYITLQNQLQEIPELLAMNSDRRSPDITEVIIL